ncbi:hypothetical protein BE221DRAFT_79600 [Ostreococcus tauri]|uniref:Uncharacterized protein n=1 Tax=Ostreococcus tauri TaxID=70448 RepID=A0A1Y5I2R8_OSTTA|nr:hypothetical protein BE221DRAFT_79600 [Ostreococcus tauri]
MRPAGREHHRASRTRFRGVPDRASARERRCNRPSQSHRVSSLLDASQRFTRDVRRRGLSVTTRERRERYRSRRRAARAAKGRTSRVNRRAARR